MGTSNTVKVIHQMNTLQNIFCRLQQDFDDSSDEDDCFDNIINLFNNNVPSNPLTITDEDRILQMKNETRDTIDALLVTTDLNALPKKELAY